MAPQGGWLSEKQMKAYMEDLLQKAAEGENITIDLGHIQFGNTTGRTKGTARIFQRLRQVLKSEIGIVAKEGTSVTIDSHTAKFIFNNNDTRGALSERMGSYFEAAVYRELRTLAGKPLSEPIDTYKLHQAVIDEIDIAAKTVAKAYTRRLGNKKNIKISRTSKGDKKGDIVIDYEVNNQKKEQFIIELKYYQPDATWIKYFELIDRQNFGGATLEAASRGRPETWFYGPGGAQEAGQLRHYGTDDWTLAVRTKGFDQFIADLKTINKISDEASFLRYLLRKGRNHQALTKKDLIIGGIVANENGAIVRVNVNELVKVTNSGGIVKAKTGAAKYQFVTQSPGQVIAELTTSQSQIRSRSDNLVARSNAKRSPDGKYHWGSTFYLHVNRMLAEQQLGTIIK